MKILVLVLMLSASVQGQTLIGTPAGGPPGYWRSVRPVRYSIRGNPVYHHRYTIPPGRSYYPQFNSSPRHHYPPVYTPTYRGGWISTPSPYNPPIGYYEPRRGF